ncbi:MAG: methyltransferase domain-containing protein [Candidatus Lokiarchaeota archaeon]|nr:methyltransferase domain-containing protein [Candidatus Lokiarchaeota archaeon]
MTSKGVNWNNFKITPHPTLDVYNKLAKSYDKRNAMMERVLSKARSIFSVLKGDVLEVGTGTGFNLKHYNPKTNIVALDWSPGMVSQAHLKVKKHRLENVKEIIIGDIQKLSDYFDPESFDYVTSSCVFCSVPNPTLGLKEVFKVLRPYGKLIQIEHGLTEIKLINLGLELFDPFTFKRFGFHLNRNHFKNLENSGFEITHHQKIDRVGIFRLLISKKSLKYKI